MKKGKGEKRGRQGEERVVEEVIMHLTGGYTPALHMSSTLSFKSSLQEDRGEHRDSHSQRHTRSSKNLRLNPEPAGLKDTTATRTRAASRRYHLLNITRTHFLSVCPKW